MVGSYLTVASRVLEKGACYASVLLGIALEKFLKPWHTKAQLWTDCGGHFRSKAALTTAGTWHCAERGISMSWTLWPEQHGKTQVDGYFGGLRKHVQKSSMVKDITTEYELVDAFESSYSAKHQLCMDVDQPTEFFMVFKPTIHRSKIPMKQFNDATWHATAMIQSCWNWEIINKDSRRKSMVGSDGKTCTGLSLRAPLVAGRKHLPWRQCTPVLAPIVERTEEEQEWEASVDSSTLTDETSCFRGWRVSYRLMKPEVVSVLEQTTKAKKKLLAIEDVLSTMTKHDRGRSLHARMAAASASGKRSAALQHAFAKACKSGPGLGPLID